MKGGELDDFAYLLDKKDQAKQNTINKKIENNEELSVDEKNIFISRNPDEIKRQEAEKNMQKNFSSGGKRTKRTKRKSKKARKTRRKKTKKRSRK